MAQPGLQAEPDYTFKVRSLAIDRTPVLPPRLQVLPPLGGRGDAAVCLPPAAAGASVQLPASEQYKRP